MSKSKKSAKSAKIPQPIKIKKEKTEEDRAIYAMSHYVDDRLELVKQIFGSLKTKTITNLAPDYLKEKEMEEIQELCLNELLCLSKKRLLSVINDTKCPTDTESSDDSDVEAKEEHVSLEEISSDSELENGGKAHKKSGSQSRTKRDTKKTNQTDQKKENDGQMSVLELLELQARARAIRSQLALEPITKIEVDSDDGGTKKTPDKSSSDKNKQSNKKSKEKLVSSASIVTSPVAEEQKSNNVNSCKTKESQQSCTYENSNGDLENSTSTKSKQKIKIKRNFRKTNLENFELESTDEQQVKTQDNIVAKEVKQGKSPRSQSPDVIPIEPEPETFCISDSGSDAENNKDKKSSKQAKSTKSINPASIASASTELSNENNISVIQPQEPEEAEDGEIIEQDTDLVEQVTENTRTTAEINNLDCKPTQHDEHDQHQTSVPSNEDIIGSDRSKDTKTAANNLSDSSAALHLPSQSAMNDSIDNETEHSDDVISIEGGDLENELSEHLDEDTNTSKHSSAYESKNSNQTESNKSGNNEIDIVSLDSSENDDESGNDKTEESWQTRYMRSSKVNKVLAVSRLGKRVRDKLKTSKRSKKDSSSDKSLQDELKVKKFTSKHEDGSMEQYKELIELSQRKT